MKFIQINFVLGLISSSFLLDATSQEFQKILQKIMKFGHLPKMIVHNHSYQSGLQSMQNLVVQIRNIKQGKTANISEYDLYRLKLESENTLKEMHKEVAQKLDKEK